MVNIRFDESVAAFQEEFNRVADAAVAEEQRQMTDRVNYLTVTLERDIRVDDAQPIIEAIRMLRGVVGVGINVDSPESFSAEARVKAELIKKIWEFVK